MAARTATGRAIAISVLIGLVAVVAVLWLRYGWIWHATAGLLHPLREDFHLSGVVVDEQGNPLENVRLTIGKGHSYPLGADPTPPDVERRVISSSSFDVVASGYHYVSLGFAREGYYSEFLPFDPIGPRGRVAGPIVDRDIRVVMQKKGEPTKLTPFAATVTFAPDGSGSVLDLGRPSTNPMSSHVTPVEVTDLTDGARLPRPGMFATAELTAEGRIATVDDPQRRGFVVKDPRRITLRMTSPDDGFVPFQPHPGKKPRRQMTEAPAGGYERVLELTPRDAAPGWDDRRAFFYFRSGGRYGRGYVIPSVNALKDGKQVARFELGVFIQPDGSRNLEDDAAAP